jgi:branched-chain amino acid transport system permease protein
MGQLILNIIQSILLYTVIAFSLKNTYTTTRFFNIGHAITITIAAYFTFLFTIIFKFNIFISVSLSILFSILLSNLIYLYIFKPLLKLKVPNWQMLIASLGIYIILQNILSMYFGDDAKSFRIWEVKEGHMFLETYITDIQIITISVSIGVLILSWFFIEKTYFGKQIKAVSSNPGLSNIFGISTNKAIMYSFVLGSTLAATAGILIAADTDMTPTMGFNWLIYAVAAMIIGGMGKMRYLLLGAILLATAQQLTAYYLDNKWMNAITYIILIVFLFFKPYGFSGVKLKKAEL